MFSAKGSLTMETDSSAMARVDDEEALNNDGLF
jgi:hypothetical protein